MASAQWRNSIVFIVIFGLVAACASNQTQTNPQFSSKSEPLRFEVDRYDEIDLVILVDPQNRRTALPGDVCANAEADLDARDRDVRRDSERQQLECAFQAFKTYSVTYDAFLSSMATDGDEIYQRAGSSVALALRRNEIQDRLMLRSEALCRDFERRLNIDLTIENDTNLTNFFRNSQRRVIGGVGSLLLGGDVVWALTNATRITDLPGYVHDEGQIEKTMIRIAIDGWKKNREVLLTEIDRKRRAPVRHGGLSVSGNSVSDGVTPITIYTLERAIADALAYHNSCSVNTGLTYAAHLVATSDEPLAPVDYPDLIPSTVN